MSYKVLGQISNKIAEVSCYFIYFISTVKVIKRLRMSDMLSRKITFSPKTRIKEHFAKIAGRLSLSDAVSQITTFASRI